MRYKAKCVKNCCFQEGVGQFEPRFQGKGSSLGNIFGFYKTRHILLSDSANCTVLHEVVLTQYWHVSDRRTDRWTDGIAIASTALAMCAVIHTRVLCHRSLCNIVLIFLFISWTHIVALIWLHVYIHNLSITTASNNIHCIHIKIHFIFPNNSVKNRQVFIEFLVYRIL